MPSNSCPVCTCVKFQKLRIARRSELVSMSTWRVSYFSSDERVLIDRLYKQLLCSKFGENFSFEKHMFRSCTIYTTTYHTVYQFLLPFHRLHFIYSLFVLFHEFTNFDGFWGHWLHWKRVASLFEQRKTRPFFRCAYIFQKK